jgi:hypothetical protein
MALQPLNFANTGDSAREHFADEGLSNRERQRENESSRVDSEATRTTETTAARAVGEGCTSGDPAGLPPHRGFPQAAADRME